MSVTRPRAIGRKGREPGPLNEGWTAHRISMTLRSMKAVPLHFLRLTTLRPGAGYSRRPGAESWLS
jgi:hypothetical protein